MRGAIGRGIAVGLLGLVLGGVTFGQEELVAGSDQAVV